MKLTFARLTYQTLSKTSKTPSNDFLQLANGSNYEALYLALFASGGAAGLHGLGMVHCGVQHRGAVSPLYK